MIVIVSTLCYSAATQNERESYHEEKYYQALCGCSCSLHRYGSIRTCCQRTCYGCGKSYKQFHI
jgi:hypothetical protein